MPDYEVLYPGRFLKGKTMEGPKVIRISSLAPTDLEGDDGMEAKAVMRYRSSDGDGEMVLCKTNAALIAEMFGERDYTKWAGRLVTFHYDPTVRFGPKAVGGIRVMGSPDLKSKLRVELTRPRRKKPEVYVLVPTPIDKQGRLTGNGSGPPTTCNREHAQMDCGASDCDKGER